MKKCASLWRGAVALVLVLCMVLGFCPVPAHAAEESLKYVTLGDSMTNGYGLEGYDVYGDVGGYLTVVPEAYPAKFSAWLEEYTGKNVELTQLAISRMRSQDVCYLLTYGSENQFPEDDYTRNWLHKLAQSGDLENIYPGAGGIGTMAKKFQSSVKAADLISIDLGNNDFGTFLTNRFCYELAQFGFNFGELSSYEDVDLDNLLDTVDPAIAAAASILYDTLLQMLLTELENQGVTQEFALKLAESMVDVAVYTYVGFVLAYKGIMEYIADNNADAEVLIVTLPNHMKGMQIAMSGENGENVVLDMDSFYGSLIDSANIYVSALPSVLESEGKRIKQVYYATPQNVGLMIEELAKGNYAEYPGLREAMVEELPDFVFGIMDPGGEMFSADITVDEVTELEAVISGEDAEAALGDLLRDRDEKNLLSCAAYLGLEQACIRAANEGVINAGTFAALMDTGEMDRIFTEVQERYHNLLAEAVTADPAPGAQLLATPAALAEALDDPTVNALLHLVCRFLIGNSIGCHASNAGYDTVTAAMAEAYREGYTADQALEESMKLLQALIRKYAPTVEDILSAATKSRFVPQEDSLYVSLGDGSAVASGYPEKLAEKLGIAHKNLAKTLATVQDQLALLSEEANAACIEKADLITIGFGNGTFIGGALDGILGFEEELDWTQYVSESDAAKIRQTIRNIVLDKTGSESAMIESALEVFLFRVVAYACDLPVLVNEIHDRNPDALVVIVGMYNPLDGVIFEMNGIELDIGDYVNYLVEAEAAHAMAYCAATGNAIYVDAREVDTVNQKSVLQLSNMLQLLMRQCEQLNPSEEGDSYIAEQILSSLVIAQPGSVKRIAGNDRYETSFAIANELKTVLGVEKFDSVVLASSETFADALAGSYLAAVENAPIIIGKAKYADKVCAYLNENLASGATVYILGGESALPGSILEGLTVDYTPVRLAGEDRYETNLEILKAAPVSGDLLIATGRDFADSLSASATGLPILLVNGKAGKSLTQEQKEFLAAVPGNIYIIGGESAVPAAMKAEIEAASGKSAQRISGGSRYETSVEIAEAFLRGNDSAVLAYASTYPDGLCGGPLAYAMGAPLILTKNGKTEAAEYAEERFIAAGAVLGGESLISDATARTVFGLSARAEIVK